MTRFFRTLDHVYFPQTNLLKDIKTYLKAAANRETELMKKQQELEEKVCYYFCVDGTLIKRDSDM